MVQCGEVVKTLHFQCKGVWVWSLVRGLRTHMLHSQENYKKYIIRPGKEEGKAGSLVSTYQHPLSYAWSHFQLLILYQECGPQLHLIFRIYTLIFYSLQSAHHRKPHYNKIIKRGLWLFNHYFSCISAVWNYSRSNKNELQFKLRIEPAYSFIE